MYNSPTQAFKAIPTTYADVDFRSRLEARYAAFFDLAGWKWEYEPLDLDGWIPDFRVTCGDRFKDCDRDHALLVEVKPYYRIDDFRVTVEYQRAMAELPPVFTTHCNATALFGNNPAVSFWEEWHGCGRQSIPDRVLDWQGKWNRAGNMVQWQPGGKLYRQ